MERKEIETRVSRIWVGEDGIVRETQFINTDFTLENAKESMATISKVSKGRRLPLLVDSLNTRSMTRECRRYLASDDVAKTISAVAVIIGTPVSRVLGNFALGVSKPQIPTRLFTSEQEALEWLKGFLK